MNKIVLVLFVCYLATSFSVQVSPNDINFVRGIILPLKFCYTNECIVQKESYALKSHISDSIECETDGLKVAIKGNDGSVPLSD